MPYFEPIVKILEAYQWFKNGDIPGDGVINNINSGAIVKRHITHGHFTGSQICKICDKPMSAHGIVVKPIVSVHTTLCPGDYLEVFRDDRNRIIGYIGHQRKAFEEVYKPHIPDGETK